MHLQRPAAVHRHREVAVHLPVAEKVLLVLPALVAQAEEEPVEPVDPVGLHDVPEDRLRAILLHGLRPVLGLLAQAGALAPAEDHHRHVVLDEPSEHRPDRIEINLHTDPANVAMTVQFSIPLYINDAPVWREHSDAAGRVDVIAIELEPAALPSTRLLQPFTPGHLVAKSAHASSSSAFRSDSTTPSTAFRSHARPSSRRHSGSASRGSATSSPMRACTGARAAHRSLRAIPMPAAGVEY